VISIKIAGFGFLTVDGSEKNQDTVNMRHLERLFKPDEIYCDLHEIDFAKFASRGYQLVMLDIDNTLAHHGSNKADEFAREAVRRIQDAGLICWIISNGNTHRISLFAASLNLPFVAMSNKPSRRAFKYVFKVTGIDANRAVMIGDQLLTDIFGAHRAGCLAVLVHPRFEQEAWNVRFKRSIEKPLLKRFRS